MTENRDIIFHLLDIQSRDMRIESEDEVAYESASDDDDEFQTKRKKKKNNTFQQRELVIHLFGTTETGDPVRCDVTGFKPTFYLRLPEEKTSLAAETLTTYIRQEGIPMENITIKRITKKIFYGFTAQTAYPFLQLEVPSLSLFRTLRGLFLDDQLNPCTKKKLDGPWKNTKVEVFEANIDPMLRFLHVQNIQPCGWVRVKDGMLSVSSEADSSLVTDCNYDQVVPTKGPRVSAPFLTASWDIECFSMTGDFPVAKRTWRKAAKDLIQYASSGKEAAEWIVKSLSTGDTPVDTLPPKMTPIYCTLKKKELSPIVAKLEGIQAELDSLFRSLKSSDEDSISMIETLLDKTLKSLVYLRGDPVIQIGTTLTRGLQSATDSTDKHLFVFPDCAPIPGITVHAYPTEKEMILAWFKWMIKLNPDILIGYNVFGFDESYTWHRAEELGLIHDSSPIHELTRLFELASEMKLEEKFLSSSAMGDNRMYIWTTHGRLQIDMFHYIKRNFVLPSYKLDEVTKHFMSGKIKKRHYDGSTLTLEVAGAIKDVRSGRSITLLDDTGETVSPKLTVTTVNGSTLTFACVLDEDALTEMEDATKWVIVKDDVSPQDIFRLHRGSAEDRAIVGKYCLQDCDLVVDLYRKLETFNNSMSMANVCTVPVGYIFTRGQGIKIESLIFKFCRELDIVIPVLPVPSQSGATDTYEGAIVLDPEPGFYSISPIGVCDFASLYPSTIVSENISHDSLLWIKDFKEDGTLISHNWGSELYDEHAGYAYTDIEFDIIRPDPDDARKNPKKIKCGRRICRYAQPLDGTKSTLPQITTWLLTARSMKKKEMKAEKDPERYALLDAEQLAYKLTGNSLYGQLGSSTFKIRLQALAASVTSYGRKQIMFAKAAIEKFYGPEAKNPAYTARAMAKVVYGDSVTGDTPLLIRCNGVEINIPMDHLWELEPGKEWITERDKDFYELDHCESWTETGWTKIHRIIRHELPSHKKLMRIYLQGGGYITVTDDHSLLLSSGETVSPKSLYIGCKLLSTKYSDGDKVTNITELDKSGELLRNKYKTVYDLTTDNHHFQAGPEGLIVHNTDSIFIEFNPRNPETGERLEGREARQKTIDLTNEAGHFITKALAAPHDFEFDKAYDPLLLFSKKRYAGNMYEENADEYVHKYMGIALKRRDNAPIVKTIFGGAMKMLLDKRDVVGAFAFVKEKCMELVQGKVSLGQLAVTKSLRADYANPGQIAHKVLADRITSRDPGNAPAAGDRIGYVYISPKSGQQASALQGDRIETPQFIKDHGLIPDYRHYIEHQLQNPISQAFGLLLEMIPGCTPSMMKGCPTIMEDLDKYLAFREGKAAELLFGDCLKTFELASKRNAMSCMFGGNVVITSSRTKKADSAACAAFATANTVKASVKGKVSAPSVQTTMSSFLLDTMVVDKIRKNERAAKAKATREKEKEAKEKEETQV
uniref:DNA-directed DNA polymerase n=1 Tax=viral metagenome TaxID=1070528 RepID=A0A6C0IGW3_9ZZZZ